MTIIEAMMKMGEFFMKKRYEPEDIQEAEEAWHTIRNFVTKVIGMSNAVLNEGRKKQ